MNKLNVLFIFSLMAMICLACNSGNAYEDHPLVGNYMGEWRSSSVTVPNRKISIEANDYAEGLVLFNGSLRDTHHLELQSETQFTLERFEVNGISNAISGVFDQDSLHLLNTVYPISDPGNTQTREGKFKKLN